MEDPSAVLLANLHGISGKDLTELVIISGIGSQSFLFIQ